MLETLWAEASTKLTEIFAGGGLVTLATIWWNNRKTSKNLPTDIKAQVSSTMSDAKDTIIKELKEELLTQTGDSESTMTQRIETYKDKVYSNYLSEERRTHYLQLAKDEANKLQETYGAIIPLPNTVQDVENT